MRYKMLLSYKGAGLSGWQSQDNAPTVQDHLEAALKTLMKEEVPVTGVGRTDAGVNAISYVAHFDAPANPEFFEPRFRCKLNAILPREIVVHELSEVEDNFHARFDAKKREYRYFLHRKKDPFMEGRSLLCTYPLDVAKMNEAATLLLGRKDFSCFEKTGSSNKTSICTIFQAHWDAYEPDHVRMMNWPAEEGDYLVFTISADRFLRGMVRAIVGSLIAVGRGKYEPQWITALLESKDRCQAGESVPGDALTLSRVEY